MESGRVIISGGNGGQLLPLWTEEVSLLHSLYYYFVPLSYYVRIFFIFFVYSLTRPIPLFIFVSQMVDIAAKEGGISVAANGGERRWRGWLGLAKEDGSGVFSVSLFLVDILFRAYFQFFSSHHHHLPFSN